MKQARWTCPCHIWRPWAVSRWSRDRPWWPAPHQPAVAACWPQVTTPAQPPDFQQAASAQCPSDFTSHTLPSAQQLRPLLIYQKAPSRGRTAGCYLFTVSNSGLLPVQRCSPSFTDTAAVTDTCGVNSSIDHSNLLTNQVNPITVGVLRRYWLSDRNGIQPFKICSTNHKGSLFGDPGVK